MNARGRWFQIAVFFGFLGVCAALLFLCLGSWDAAAPEAQSTPLVLEMKLDREVEPILATYIDEGLADAAHRQAALALITMDTPAGLSDSMTDMIHHILESPVPVAVFVSPARAPAASPASFILSSAKIPPLPPATLPRPPPPLL